MDSCSDYIERRQAPLLTSFKNLVLVCRHLWYLGSRPCTFLLGSSLALLCIFVMTLGRFSHLYHFCRAGYLEAFADMYFIVMIVMLLTARNSRHYSISNGTNMSYYWSLWSFFGFMTFIPVFLSVVITAQRMIQSAWRWQ